MGLRHRIAGSDDPSMLQVDTRRRHRNRVRAFRPSEARRFACIFALGTFLVLGVVACDAWTESYKRSCVANGGTVTYEVDLIACKPHAGPRL